MPATRSQDQTGRRTRSQAAPLAAKKSAVKPAPTRKPRSTVKKQDPRTGANEPEVKDNESEGHVSDDDDNNDNDGDDNNNTGNDGKEKDNKEGGRAGDEVERPR